MTCCREAGLQSRQHRPCQADTAWLSQPCRWNCMNAAFMQYEQAGPGPRPGGTGVTGARQDAPAPQTPKPRNTSCVLTHWKPSLIAFRSTLPGRMRAMPGRLGAHAGYAAGWLAAQGGYAVGALAEMTWVLLRPVSLAWYRAASAAASMSVSSRLSPFKAATPTEMVSLMTWPDLFLSSTGMDMAATWARRRSATLSASISRACGSRIANSSPPNRPARS